MDSGQAQDDSMSKNPLVSLRSIELSARSSHDDEQAKTAIMLKDMEGQIKDLKNIVFENAKQTEEVKRLQRSNMRSQQANRNPAKDDQDDFY